MSVDPDIFCAVLRCRQRRLLCSQYSDALTNVHDGSVHVTAKVRVTFVRGRAGQIFQRVNHHFLGKKKKKNPLEVGMETEETLLNTFPFCSRCSSFYHPL